MEEEQLKSLTDLLLAYNREARAHYERARETGQQGDFYSQVKPFADKVKEAAEEWEPLATLWLAKKKPKNLYPMQIHNTAENIQMVSVRAFFPETSLKKFQSHIQSVEYVLERLRELLLED